jgi:lipopolysaccharide export LptBFGC system permease protein LptF
MNSEEDVFVSKALENVEKAEKYWRVKKIVTTLLLCAAAVWVAFQPPFPSGRNGAYTVIILIGLMLAVCTVKIMSLMNKNTISVLRAIADLQRR